VSAFSFSRLVLPVLALAVGTGVQASDQVALETLQRMQAAAQNINYHGTLIFLQDGQVQSMQVVHKADDKGRFERLINLNGVAREVVRRDDVVVCYMPDSKEVMVSRQKFSGNVLSKLANNDFSQLQENYEFTLEGLERVAGRPARRIHISPKDKLRYGYRLWVGKENAVLLKSDLLNEKGETLEQAMFADIAIVDRIPDPLLTPTSTGEGYTWYEREPEARKTITNSDWVIDPLPKGFAVVTRFWHQMPGASAPSEHWVLSDGLANVSVYFEKLSDKDEPFVGLSPMGAINAFGGVRDGHQITVIGEVPAQTVELLVHSVASDGDAGDDE